MHGSFDEVKFLPDTTTYSRVICASEKLMHTVVNTLAPTFSIGSYSFFRVTRTTLKSRQILNLRQFGPRATELAALERIEKKSHKLIMGGITLAWMSSNFGKFATELRPLIDVRI